MNRQELKSHIGQTYGILPDTPWMDYPEYEVFRHPNNKKWFALVMAVPKSKLGLTGDGFLDVLNIKCDPILIGSLRGKAGFFPAYHMSKASWISVALDGTAEDEEIKWLLDLSHNLTAPKIRKQKRRQEEQP